MEELNTLSRRAERRAETIHEIHTRAWQQMAQQGPASLSLRELSRSMRMSSAAIYRYYPNRSALISALMIEAFGEINAAMRAGAASSPADDPARQILGASLAYRAWALAHPEKYALIYGSPVTDYRPEWETLLSPAKEGLEIILDLARSALAQGLLDPHAAPLLSPALQRQMEAILTQRAYGVPAPLLFAVITGWTRLHGMVSLEVFGHILPLIPDMQAAVEQEITALIRQIGIKEGKS